MKLKRLVLQGFRSFYDRTEIIFPDAGVVMLRGASGSGKTSILLGISYALGFSPYPGTQLRAWGEVPFLVELELEASGKTLLISRADKLSLTIDGVKVPGTAKQLETKIQDLLLPTTMLEAMTWRGQRRDGMFLSLGDTDRKKFLTELLGLDRFEVAVEAAGFASASAKLKEESLASDLGRVLEQIQTLAQVQAPPPQDLSLGPALVDLERSLDGLRNQANALEIERNKVKSRVNSDTEAINTEAETRIRALPPVSAVDDSVIVSEIAITQKKIQDIADEYELAQAKAQTQARNLCNRKTRLDVLEDERKGLLSQLEQLEKSLCPTCSRTWDEAQAKADAVRARMTEVETLLSTRPQLEAEMAAFSPPSEPKELGLARDRLLYLNSEIVKSKALTKALAQERKLEESRIRDEARTQQIRLMKESEAEIEANANALRQLHLQIQEISGRERELRNRIQAEALTWNKANTLYEHAQTRLRQLEEEKTRLLSAQELALTEYKEQADLVSALGREGFLGRIFDEVLAETASYCNEFMLRFPNTEKCSLRWVSESQTKSGTVSKTLTPILSFGGVEAPFKSGCSGGMFSVLDLAMDLALADTMSKRLGKVPGWIVLDEAFDGMGAPEKEAALEFLDDVARDRLVLVVDHDAVIVEGRHQYVDVVIDNGRSRVL